MQKLTMAEIEERNEAQKAKFLPQQTVIILDNVRSALNVGSVFRTADVFSINELGLCGITAQPPSREILKTALGAVETVKWQYFPTTIEAVAHYRAEGYLIFAVEQVKESIMLHEFPQMANTFPHKKFVIIVGNEVEGVAADVIDLCDACIEIPQVGSKHSLNVSVAASIVAWEIQKLYMQ